jgi:glutaredoxin
MQLNEVCHLNTTCRSMIRIHNLLGERGKHCLLITPVCPRLVRTYSNRYHSLLRHTEHLMNVILYTRTGCHLCDDALTTLNNHGLVPAIVDIDADPKLRDQFNTCVPVVEINGKVRFRGKVDPVLLRRLLQHG